MISHRFPWDISYVALNTSLVNNLIDLIGGHPRLQCTSRNIQDLTSQTANDTHTLLFLLVQDFNLMLAP
jgi:hypothetical protein